MASFTPHLRKRISKWAVFNKNYGSDGKFEVKPGEHFWKDFADEHAEQAKKEKGIADFASFDKSTDEHAIVAVGTTGTGKSSLVQLFCGDEVGVSHGTTSETKHAELFDEIGDDALPNRKWMDTQGTDDSDMDDTDEKILKKIFKKLWLKKIHFITVLWMISGDFDRQKGEYLRQAKFIQSLQTKDSPSNIWNSVLMVQKKGTLQPKPRKIRGIIDAAKANGAKMAWIDDEALAPHVVGFKCIELINLKGGDDMYETLVDAETPQEKLISLGYVTQAQMKTIVAERLHALDCFMLSYLDKICEKCSLRGDPRYLYYKCHATPAPHHPKQLEPYHPKPLEQYHPLGTHVIHPGSVQHRHPKPLEHYHPQEMVEEEVDDTEHPIYDHPGEWITVIEGKFCCTKERQKWNCCQSEVRHARGCRQQFPKKTVLRYPCCDRKKDMVVDQEEKGCDEEFHGGCKQRYLCCQGGPDSEPCESKYDCCGQPPLSEGCQTVWKCCEEAEDQPGCKERYQCCQMPEDARGCEDRWACCLQAPEELGCQTVCLRCNVRWGHKPGCMWPEPDDDGGDEKVYHDPDEPEQDDYDEAHNPMIMEEVAEERQAQLEAEQSPAPMLGAVPLGSVPPMGSVAEDEVSSPRSRVDTLPTENLL